MTKIIFYIISHLYGLITFVRNFLFNIKIFRSKSFNTAVICVGNLTAGGTGKTPHTEYLIRLLKDKYKVAVLSRGYKRITKGYVEADEYTTIDDIGDEPLQIKHKFKDIVVSVCENRVYGINKLTVQHLDVNVVLLDDAFQHRWVKPHLSVVLTDFHNIFTKDSMLPYGMLREYKSGYKRADIIIVSKTPVVLSPIERRSIIEEIKPLPHQKVFFSYIKYHNLEPFKCNKTKCVDLNKVTIVLAITGIANSYPLLDYLKRKFSDVTNINYPDHHNYTEEDVYTIVKKFNDLPTKNKIIITTEKDSMRLCRPEFQVMTTDIPFYYIPIEIGFHNNDMGEFNDTILKKIDSIQTNEANLPN